MVILTLRSFGSLSLFLALLYIAMISVLNTDIFKLLALFKHKESDG
ncbi:MAG: hypothetical protein R2779_03465 [Crocinitomicaceae bacterium]